MADQPKYYKFGELNSAEHSQNAESLEPENHTGLDLIAINNQKTTEPNVIKKLIGPLKGVVLKGVADSIEEESGNSRFDVIIGKKFAKHRIRIPELHAHLPEPEDYNNVPQSIACLYPEFIAQTTDIKKVAAGTVVWCNFLDRENFQDPVYLGAVDDQAYSNSATKPPNRVLTGLSAVGASLSSAGQSISKLNVTQTPSSNPNVYNQINNAPSGSVQSDVLAIAFSYPDAESFLPNKPPAISGHPYDIQGTGVVEDIYHNGKILLKYTGSTYCNGFTFTVLMKVLTKRNLIINKSFKEMLEFQKMWYGIKGDTEKQAGPALKFLGVGDSISAQDAIPGDFLQIWRTNKTGHSTVFLGWEQKNGKIVGVKYRSTQGKAKPESSGIGSRTEYFSDAGGSVVRERTYLARVF